MWLQLALLSLVPLSLKIAQLSGQIDRCYAHLGYDLPADERRAYATWLTELLMERYNLTGRPTVVIGET